MARRRQALGPEGLNATDPGVRLLGTQGRAYGPPGGEDHLLVHCGDVPGIGSAATRLVLDVRELPDSRHPTVRATVDGPAGTLERRDFAAALCWPRAHLGMDFSEACLAEAALRLREGGHLLCAVRKAKGGKRLAELIGDLLGEVDVLAREGGYALWIAERGASMNEPRARELVGRRYLHRDPDALGDLQLEACPGVFSRKKLDSGTRVLLTHLASLVEARAIEAPARVLDLGAGIGTLGLRAVDMFPGARLFAVDSNLVAVSLVAHNAQRNGLADRVRVVASDGLPPLEDHPGVGPVDLALVNPPTHADKAGIERFLGALKGWVRPGGVAMVVVNRPGRAIEALKQVGAKGEMYEYPGYFVLEARF